MKKTLHVLAGTLVLTALVSCGGGAPQNPPAGTTPGTTTGVRGEIIAVKHAPSGAGTGFEVTFKNTGTKTIGNVGAIFTFTKGTQQVDEAVVTLSSTLKSGEFKSAVSTHVPNPTAYDCYEYEVTFFADDYSATHKYTSESICTKPGS